MKKYVGNYIKVTNSEGYIVVSGFVVGLIRLDVFIDDTNMNTYFEDDDPKSITEGVVLGDGIVYVNDSINETMEIITETEFTQFREDQYNELADLLNNMGNKTGPLYVEDDDDDDDDEEGGELN